MSMVISPSLRARTIGWTSSLSGLTRPPTFDRVDVGRGGAVNVGGASSKRSSAWLSAY
jgi:hypothetical protein